MLSDWRPMRFFRPGHQVIACLLWLSLASAATATTFELELTGLLGTVPFSTGGHPVTLTLDFDFGLEFSSVDALSLEIEATVTPLEFGICGRVVPGPCSEHRSDLMGFVPNLVDVSPLPIFTSVGPFNDAGPLLSQGEFGVGGFPGAPDPDFSLLLDGIGSLRVG